MDSWIVASALSKLALYGASFVCVGLIINATLFPKWVKWTSFKRLVVLLAFIGFAVSGISFVLRGAFLMGDMSGATDPEILALLWTTSVGTSLFMRAVGFGLILVAALVPRSFLWLGGAGGLLVLWSFTQIGHILDLGSLAVQAILLAHLAVVALWIGVLLPLRRMTANDANYESAANLGHAFGRVAIFAIPALLLAGIVLTYFLVGSFSALISPYGLALLVKLVGVAVLLALGALNKLRFVPQLRDGNPKAANHLQQSIQGEWVLFFAIFATTAALTSAFSPPGL